ncbi:MAG: DegT/DnrJ/EryC1/StrS family aminotransferase [Firmicutes bacterium]|nr:DegT/DnrJ/EryC1/StrS family aminotransferase [Bacillota bacterium]
MSTLAIDGGTPVRTRPFPTWPDLGGVNFDRVMEVLRSNQLSPLSGSMVKQFESAFGQHFGLGEVVATNSGTAAVHTALAALGVGPGDEVIVTAHSFIGSASPIVMCGATPVFADVDPRTFTMDPKFVEKLITSKTKAIVSVDLNGHPVDYHQLLPLAKQAGIPIVEDAAQAHGATLDGKYCGTFGDIAAWSFWEDKIMPIGEGGAVSTPNPELAHRARMFINHGEEPPDKGYHETERLYYHHFLGYNYRLHEALAAIGLSVLPHVDEWASQRQQNADYLSQQFSSIPGCMPMYVAPGAKPTYYVYILTLDIERFRADITTIVQAIRREGIPASRRYSTPLHKQPVFQHWLSPHQPDLPVCESLPRSLIRLTVPPNLTRQDLDDVVAAVAKVLHAYQR